MLPSFIFDVHKIKVPFYLLSTGYNKRLTKLKKKKGKSLYHLKLRWIVQSKDLVVFFPFSSRVCSSKLMLALSTVCVPA